MLTVCFADMVNNWITSTYYLAWKSSDKFINYLFPEAIKVSIGDQNTCDAVIYGIQDYNPYVMNDSKINIMVCVENCYCHNHYRHYNAFGNFGNPKIDIYFYNHIDRCVVTDKYLAIPIIYCQITYFKRFYNKIGPTIITPFDTKKFCLFTCSNVSLDKQKTQIKSFLQTLGKCDDVSTLKKELGNASCYHSLELMNLFNQYKFIFVSENSITDGYITEKILNGYFSRTIPIYFGSSTINKYFNPDSFINVNNFNNLPLIKDQIKLLN